MGRSVAWPNWAIRRPEALTEAAWRADRELLEREHRALRDAVKQTVHTPRGQKLLKHIYGVAFHDIYHAGQVRLLRRLMTGGRRVDLGIGAA